MERKKIISKYLSLESLIWDWCEKVIDLLNSYSWVDKYGHKKTFLEGRDFSTFKVFNDEIEIITVDTYDYERYSFWIPIEVFYEESEESYVKGLYEENVKKIEKEKKKQFESDKEKAINKINELKEKFGLE